MYWLKLIRIKNLFLIGLSQFLVFYILHKKVTITLFLFITITFLYAAAGNIINDIFDIATDKINKPSKLVINKYIKPEIALRMYWVLNGVAFISSLIIYFITQNYWFLIFLSTIPLLLYYYSKTLKSIPFIGNLTIAMLTTLTLLLLLYTKPPIFDMRRNIVLFSLFAFFTNLIREIVKDLEDIDGDYAAKLNTLPIVIGTKRTLLICKIITAILISYIMCILFLTPKISFKLFLVTIILAPVLYIFYLISIAKLKTDYSKISMLLKMIMAFSLGSLLFI